MDYRCAQFNISFPPIMDGIANALTQYAHYLNTQTSRCYTVVPMAPGWHELDRSMGLPNIIRCFSIPKPFAKPYVFPLPGPLCLSRLRKLQLDLVHTHYPVRMQSHAIQLAKEQKIPLIASFHTRYREQLLHDIKPRALAERIATSWTASYQKATEVWVPTHGAAAILRDYGYHKDNIRVMSNGTDIEIPTEAEQQRLRHAGLLRIFGKKYREVREERKGQKAQALPPLLLYIGNLLETKNLPLVMEALAITHRSGRDFHMLFVGNGYLRDELERKTRELGLQEKVSFAGTISDRTILKELLAASQLLLFPSVADTCGIVKMEAAAFAVPSLLMNESCATEGVQHDYNGFIAQRASRSAGSADSEAANYAALLKRCLDTPERCREVGLRARATLHKSWQDAVAEVDAAYREILSTQRICR